MVTQQAINSCLFPGATGVCRLVGSYWAIIHVGLGRANSTGTADYNPVSFCTKFIGCVCNVAI